MRILVTGMTGQIGSAILSRFAGSCTLLPANRASLDLTKPAAYIRQQLNSLCPDLIINAAAYTDVERSEQERDLAFAVNAQAPNTIAQWAAAVNVPLVHFSTDYVFDGTGEKPWREDDVTKPLNQYGLSKLAGEQAVRAARGPHLIVRTSWIYSATGRNFFNAIAHQARERDELCVVADQVGSPTSAMLVADVLGKIFEANQRRLHEVFAAADGVVHVAAGGATSRHGFAEVIVEGLRSRRQPVRVRHVKAVATRDFHSNADRPLNSRLDLSRLRSVFHIEPMSWSACLDAELDRIAKDRSELSTGLRDG